MLYLFSVPDSFSTFNRNRLTSCAVDWNPFRLLRHKKRSEREHAYDGVQDKNTLAFCRVAHALFVAQVR